LSKLKTLKEPPQSMPRLIDLLEYLSQPGLEEIWVLLDIKVNIDALDVGAHADIRGSSTTIRKTSCD
jgi:hypothetical protein